MARRCLIKELVTLEILKCALPLRGELFRYHAGRDQFINSALKRQISLVLMSNIKYKLQSCVLELLERGNGFILKFQKRNGLVLF